MSLLMEALRKAEHAKRNKETSSEGGDDFPQQEPAPSQAEPEFPGSEPTLEPLETPLAPSQAEASPDDGLLSFDGGTEATSTDTSPMSMELQAMEPAAPQAEAEASSPAPQAFSIDAGAPPPQPVPEVSEPAPVFVQEQSAPPQAPARNPYVPAAAVPAPEQPAAPASRSEPPKGPSLKAEQRQAKAVFSSKQTSPLRRTSFIIAAAIVICAALAAYGYFQLDKLGGSTVASSLPAPAAAPAPAVAAASVPPAAAVPQETPVEPAAPTAVDTPQAAPATSRPPEAAPARENPPPAALTAPQATLPVTTAVGGSPSTDAPAKPKPSQKPPVEVRIVKNTPQNTINPLLTSAYDAFVAGDLDAAAKAYRSVLQQDPNDRDALLGLATIAVRRDRDEEAQAFYGRLLELDPRDADAIAGMADLKRGDSAREESRLKTALTQHPQSGPILFALGNLYAQRSNWAEAQQYYFRAFGTQPNNAGYAFNLAVSLDRLSQPKLAIQYYETALNGIQSEPLDTAAIRRRITTLKGAVAP